MGIDEAAWANNYPCQPSCDPFPLPATLVYARPSGDFGSDKGQEFVSGAFGASHRHRRAWNGIAIPVRRAPPLHGPPLDYAMATGIFIF